MISERSFHVVFLSNEFVYQYNSFQNPEVHGEIKMIVMNQTVFRQGCSVWIKFRSAQTERGLVHTEHPPLRAKILSPGPNLPWSGLEFLIRIKLPDWNP